jgi:hypothetical protein
MMNDMRNEMNNEIDKLIYSLQLAKNLPGYRVKVSAVDRISDQVQNFVLYWDLKLDNVEQLELEIE